jgi:hypothetical protein
VYVSSDNVSDWAKICTGVPQGSILGPLLYLIYVNDLPSIFDYGTVHLYADDLQFKLSFKIGEQVHTIHIANSQILKLVKYAAEHNLMLNIDKTKVMTIGSRRYLNCLDSENLPHVIINGQNIPFSDTAINLGVVFDRTLSWAPHAEHVCKKVFSVLFQLKRNAYSLPLSVKKNIVNSLIMPHFGYGLVMMDDMHTVSKNRLQRVQNACVRFIFSIPKDSHITNYYNELNWLKIDELRILKISLLLWNTFRYKCPKYLYDKFEPMKNLHSRSNRYTDQRLRIPVHRTEKYARSFTVIGSKVYNQYNLYSLISYSYHTFKTRITRIIRDNLA